MGYKVQIFVVEAPVLGGLTYQEIVNDTCKHLTELENQGYEVVSVSQIDQDSKDYVYQIVSRKKENK